MNRPDYYAQLCPGATAEELDRFEGKFELKLPGDFRKLYQWRNGRNGLASLQYNRMFATLHDISSSKETLDGMIGSDFDDPKWWRRGWIPFLPNVGGDHVCLDLTAEDGGTPGQLRIFYHDTEIRKIAHPSLEAWLEDLVQSMETGSLKV